MLRAVRVLLSLLVCSALGCGAGLRAQYDMGITHADRIDTTTNQTTKLNPPEWPEGPSAPQVVEDDFVRIVYSVETDRLKFIVNNHTAGTVKVLWDSALLIDPDGQSRRLVHGAIPLADAQRAQVPSEIAPKTSLTDQVFPADMISFVDRGETPGWRVGDFIPGWQQPPANLPQMRSTAHDLLGRSFSFVLPLEIDHKEIHYVLMTTVRDVVFFQCPIARTKPSFSECRPEAEGGVIGSKKHDMVHPGE
jgi:hypothetical protein